MNAFFAELTRVIYLRRRAVVLFWAFLVTLAAFGMAHLPDVLISGSGSIPGSSSDRVEKTIRTEFSNPYTRLLALAIKGDRQSLHSSTFDGWLRESSGRLKKLPQVRKISTPLDNPDPRLFSGDGHSAIAMIGLAAENGQEEEAAVPVIRRALAPLSARMKKEDPGAQLELTGASALTYDINVRNQKDGEVAEIRALPLTLLVLLLAFGALAAAGVPILVALVGTTVALGSAFLLAHILPLSNLIQNVSTMIGLAIGIDYSLLYVSRFREALDEKPSIEEALVEAARHTAPAILYSGATVMIGLFGLFFSPLIELQSIGIGGSLVVFFSVLGACTLLPAVLGMLGRNIDFPTWLSKPLEKRRRELPWARLAHAVMDHPFRVLLLSLGLTGLIALPTLGIKTGFPSNWLPASLEAQRGIQILEEMGNGNAVIPINLVLRSRDEKPALSGRHLLSLLRIAKHLKEDPRVESVMSPVTLRSDLGPLHYLMLYHDLDAALKRYPQIGEFFLNRDRSAVLFQVIPANKLPLREAQALARDIGKLSPAGLNLEVGGQAVYYNEFHTRLMSSYLPVFLFVIGVTLVVLYAAFRSYLIPIKAVLMNLFSVMAGYGAITAVFQFGWGGQIFGLSHPLDSIPLAIPMMIFCIVFGLSMDYEVFLLSRIKEGYDRTGDNRQATADGLAKTGGVITSAALIMIAVFGAFSMAEIAFVKILGFGLAVAVLVDASLIRILMVPALMRIADRWNWLPGSNEAR
ncbi:MAG TPA: MMPL family transporter [Chroococcales cyanobacterium]|jgi:RND superfamily putative drug exporter